MSAIHVLATVCLAGIAGGLVYALGRLVDEGRNESGFVAVQGVPLWLFLCTRGLVGMGGAVAVLLVYIWLGRLSEQALTVTDWLTLAALSFVAGFIGHRLLPIVAARVERQIEEAVQKGTKEVREEVGQVMHYGRASRAIAAALADLQRPELLPLTIETDIRELESARVESPLDRTLHIVLARMYVEKLREYDKAMAVLTDFIQNKRRTGQPDDKDVADALFNRACYNSRKSIGAEAEEREELVTKAIGDLRRSIEIYPQNRLDAEKDPDFDPIRTDPRFASLVPREVGSA